MKCDRCGKTCLDRVPVTLSNGIVQEICHTCFVDDKEEKEGRGAWKRVRYPK